MTNRRRVMINWRRVMTTRCRAMINWRRVATTRCRVMTNRRRVMTARRQVMTARQQPATAPDGLDTYGNCENIGLYRKREAMGAVECRLHVAALQHRLAETGRTIYSTFYRQAFCLRRGRIGSTSRRGHTRSWRGGKTWGRSVRFRPAPSYPAKSRRARPRHIV